MRRERQDAIGDSMLVENAGAARRFDVKGYRLYDLERQSGKGPDEWLERLAELTDGLEVGAEGSNDARIAQLRGVYHAVANLIVRFHDAEAELSSVRETTLEAVREAHSRRGDPARAMRKAAACSGFSG